jgi:hypothetical protein
VILLLKPLYKYTLLLSFLLLLTIVAGYLLSFVHRLNIVFSDIAILSPSFTLIAVITLVIFFAGQTKTPERQTMYSFVAVGLKFLLELLFTLLWFIVAKKTSLQSVFIFFVIYLTFTLFSIWSILNTLKHKSL